MVRDFKVAGYFRSTQATIFSTLLKVYFNTVRSLYNIEPHLRFVDLQATFLAFKVKQKKPQ